MSIFTFTCVTLVYLRTGFWPITTSPLLGSKNMLENVIIWILKISHLKNECWPEGFKASTSAVLIYSEPCLNASMFFVLLFCSFFKRKKTWRLHKKRGKRLRDGLINLKRRKHENELRWHNISTKNRQKQKHFSSECEIYLLHSQLLNACLSRQSSVRLIVTIITKYAS